MYCKSSKPNSGERTRHGSCLPGAIRPLLRTTIVHATSNRPPAVFALGLQPFGRGQARWRPPGLALAGTPDADSDGDPLQGIVLTGQKRNGKRQRAPLVTTTITAQMLVRTHTAMRAVNGPAA